MTINDCILKLTGSPEAIEEFVPSTKAGKRIFNRRVKDLEAKGMAHDDAVTEATRLLTEEMRSRPQRMMERWKEIADTYERQGRPRHVAEVLAGEDVKLAFKREAGAKRNTFLANAAVHRKQQAQVKAATADQLRTLPAAMMKRLDLRSRALKRRFDGMVLEYLDANHRDVWGRQTGKDLSIDMAAAMHGENVTNAQAKALAEAVSYALDQMRIMANEAGANIPKLENWGLPHRHDRMRLMNAGIERLAREKNVSVATLKAKMLVNSSARNEMFARAFDQWFEDVAHEIDWSKMIDYETGLAFDRPALRMSDESKRQFLKGMFDNIVYGSEVLRRGASAEGESMAAAMSHHRILVFKDAAAWGRYNAKYGSGTPHDVLMDHVHKMARNIATMREFGTNPMVGVRQFGNMVKAEGQERGLHPQSAGKSIARSERMMRIHLGGVAPSSYATAVSATFFANTRRVMYGNLLERAAIASLGDHASMRGAARMIGMNPNNVISKYVRIVSDMAKEGTLTTENMRQMLWVAETQADPGVLSARFEGDAVSSSWSERYSTAIMRLSGMTGHTDAARATMQQVATARMADLIGMSFDAADAEMRGILRDHGITAADWDLFARRENAFVTPTGATFLDPIYWRAGTDMEARAADDLFLKFQGAMENIIEIGVPTQSLEMRAMIDPAGYGMEPGTVAYELAKSTGMFKTFVMSFTANQMEVWGRLPRGGARWAYAAKLVGEATVLGAIALQMVELLKGNDPQDMTDPMFWTRAALKGGGLAVLGDIIATGQSSWGGGFASWAAGPMLQLGQDAYDVTVKNLVAAGMQALSGQPIDVNLVPEARNFAGRYLVPKDLWAFGPAFDRLLLDQIQLILDPDSYDAMMRKARNRENLYGNGSWWMPGSPAPARLPDVGAAIGM